MAADDAFRNARQHSDPENARIESDKALGRVMNEVIADDMELFRQFADNESFRDGCRTLCSKLVYHQAGDRDAE